MHFFEINCFEERVGSIVNVAGNLGHAKTFIFGFR